MLVGASVLAIGMSTVGIAAAAPAASVSVTNPVLGSNVKIFDPSMSTTSIQAETDAIFAQQDFNEFGTERYSLFFKPGVYGTAPVLDADGNVITPGNPLDVKVGYYTEVAGLGQDPGDVVINGTVTAAGHNGSGALTTFWRSVSNLRINLVRGNDCHTSNEMWAVSQAAPMRRVDVDGFTTFMPYCENPNFASGGFVADSNLRGGALNGSQQQFYVRNSNIGVVWTNSVWNQVFSGNTGDGVPADNYQAGGPYYTTLPTTPVSKEKPYLYIDGAGKYNVFVPSLQRNSVGTTWATGHTPGTSLPISSFFVAKPSNSVDEINEALSEGKNLLLTPGVYDVAQTIKVKRANAVVLGLGYATLTAKNGVTALATADVPGIQIAGVTVDAGAVNSPVLMQIGSRNGNSGIPHTTAANPTVLSDVFFRIGGPHIGKATTSLEVNQDNTLIDHAWIWRADHGVAGSVGWTINTAAHGLVVNGDNVTATGLFVEHMQKENVIWNGENGVNVFFQHETPYDPPSQAAWDQPGDFVGYPAFQVANGVQTFHAYGMGSYVVQNQTTATANATAAYQAPVRAGVQFTHIDTVWIVGNGGYLHVINNTGPAATSAVAFVPQVVVQYP
ncbi:MAG: hypothetical protein ABIM89_07185 [Mycobacteriales bacterium]